MAVAMGQTRTAITRARPPLAVLAPACPATLIPASPAVPIPAARTAAARRPSGDAAAHPPSCHAHRSVHAARP